MTNKKCGLYGCSELVDEGHYFCKMHLSTRGFSRNRCSKTNCDEEVYEDKYFCEKHWKERRKSKKYKQSWDKDVE